MTCFLKMKNSFIEEPQNDIAVYFMLGETADGGFREPAGFLRRSRIQYLVYEFTAVIFQGCGHIVVV
jgi:hypothetical protein